MGGTVGRTGGAVATARRAGVAAWVPPVTARPPLAIYIARLKVEPVGAFAIGRIG